MTLPNFLVIGAEKSGTTSLDFYLRQHPQIYMSPMKEPRFFAPEFYTTFYHGPRVGKRTEPMSLEDYEALFDSVKGELAVGEVSPQYLYLESCCQRIAERLPEVKLIAVLRNPVDRAFSAYTYQLTCGYDLEHTFEEALALENERMTQQWRPVWHYQALGFYDEQLRRFLKNFPQANLQVLFYDDLCQDAIAFAQQAYNFLGVDPTFMPETAIKNSSAQPNNRSVHNLFFRENPLKDSLKSFFPQDLRDGVRNFVKRRNAKPKPNLSLATQQRLIETYRADILQLQDLVGRDLSPWLSV